MHVQNRLKLFAYRNNFLFQDLLINVQQSNITFGNEMLKDIQLIDVTLAVSIELL